MLGDHQPEIDLGPDEVPGAPFGNPPSPAPPPTDLCGTEPEMPGLFDRLRHKWYLLTREPLIDPDTVDLGPDTVDLGPDELPAPWPPEDLFKGLYD